MRPGVADDAIFAGDKRSVAVEMESHGVRWERAHKGERIPGWERLRSWIRYARPTEEGLPREYPGLFVVGPKNPHFLRTVPTLPRCRKNPDDVDTGSADHVGDEVRYRVSEAPYQHEFVVRMPL